MKIYVASSWRNSYQPRAVEILRQQGHDVYDFRNPAPGDYGFAWSQIDLDWTGWNPELFRAVLLHPVAIEGFRKDSDAIKACDCCVLVLPCGRSAHLEAGFAAGLRKKLIIYMPEPCVPELMYSWAEKICISEDELIFAVQDGKAR